MIQALVVIGIAAAIGLLIVLSSYNSLIQMRHEVRVAWATMDEQLKQRYVLVAELMQTVRSEGTLGNQLSAVAAAKNQAAVAYSPQQLAAAESALTYAIRQMLQAAVGIEGLNSIGQKLHGSEKLIEKSRNRYNDRITAFNESLAAFPTSTTAKLIGLKPQPAFEVQATPSLQ